ncbi:9602_t:CDS:2 [Diversispora eburnea]|uniref:9602_t:CDS:1 n=1 Tax=Diversispora eburnea TaxID=1213867 RepID=A0A9N9AS61_9GLOM|nr:9602_t:CDS:2 [Diversispora eburnea]
MDDEFDLLNKRYANWPQPIDKTIANNKLAKFHENISCDSLRESPCAVCSGLYSHEHLITISIRESLSAGDTLVFLIANVWIGMTPQCRKGLMVPEQLLYPRVIYV